ncbi:MAG TPA: hypothetical protein VLX68_09585 [Chitinivibrionales bacterium]|nr:hypothetical protein [Chitinivibrionales bacterium]
MNNFSPLQSPDFFDAAYCETPPREVREDELRALFSSEQGWKIPALRRSEFITRSQRGKIPAIAGCFERSR